MLNSSAGRKTCQQRIIDSEKYGEALLRTRETLTQLLNRNSLFALPNTFILLLVVSRFQALPRQAASEEVHENMSQTLEVVSP